MVDELESTRRARRQSGRSPSYPSIPLRTAIQRVEVVWQRERQHAIPVEALPALWGYKALNGPASTTLAALKKYGLVEDEGSRDARRARVSDLAVEILANPDPNARSNAVSQAALNPSIHVEMWEKYGPELPSDVTLRWELTRERGFTESGAADFVREYRETLAFADLADAHEPEGQEPQPDPEPEAPRRPEAVWAASQSSLGGRAAPREAPAATYQAPRRSKDYADSYKVPLPNGAVIEVVGPFPLNEAAWQQFMNVLQVMKPGLVLPDVPQLDSPSAEAE